MTAFWLLRRIWNRRSKFHSTLTLVNLKPCLTRSKAEESKSMNWRLNNFDRTRISQNCPSKFYPTLTSDNLKLWYRAEELMLMIKRLNNFDCSRKSQNFRSKFYPTLTPANWKFWYRTEELKLTIVRLNNFECSRVEVVESSFKILPNSNSG